MLSVAIDATPLLGDRTGIGVAVHGLIAELATRPELALVGYGLTARGWRRLASRLPPGVRPARTPLPAAALLRAWQRVDLPPVEWWSGPVDVVHGTNFVVPPSLRAARLVSVWDLTAVRYPEWCTPTARRYPALVERAVARGAWVHTGSAAVADEIVDHFGIERARIRVIPPGVKAAVGTPDRGQVRACSSAPYLLALGTAEPRKDFPGLVAAFDQLAARHPELELRIAGPTGWGEEALERAVLAAAHGDRVRRLGWVDDVGPLLAGAKVFVYPSRYEGFGFPPLEAMAAGVPVVATAVGSLPEVLGDGALLVPAEDADALAAALDRLLTDPALRQRLVAAGLAQVARYSWQAAGDSLMQAYRDLRDQAS